ncbi:MAG: indolepyruvate oxidoreductase subunit beta family protein [Candidatus Sulfotelmatobacter sp.]
MNTGAISTSEASRAITVAILAMGGEGGGVLADWIVDLAEHSGYLAQTTSVPGVAQRTGSTIYYIELFPEAAARRVGKEPVLALMPVPGEVDVVIASELMEAGRAVQRGLVTPDRTTLIASTHRVYSMTEKTVIADGQVDSSKLLDACFGSAKKFVRTDFAAMANDLRSVISAALFGALAATNVLPFEREKFEEAVRRGGVGIDSSLAAFRAGFDAAVQFSTPKDKDKDAGQTQRKVGYRLRDLGARIEMSFPAGAHNILMLGIERLCDYQDQRYAVGYLDRLEPVRDADARHGNGDCELLRETARYLALWMSYEDAIRVADLKTRRKRFERVGRESRQSEAQVLRINEFLYPRIEEITDMMPPGLGAWVLKTGWINRVMSRFAGNGRIVETTSLQGFLQLYLIAALRRWRRKSWRFQREHKRIGEWLEQLISLTAENYALAIEVATLPRVLKGYGDTHIRGRQSFDAMMSTIASLRGRDDGADCLKRLREAALADESGEKLAATLHEVNA